MLNKKRLQLQGLDVLGSRLRELRLRAGISQMKLAEILGLNPTHGYKYILRLEKGLVPNPTMRTITGYLIACGASWQELAAVLPGIKMVTVADNSEKTETAEPIIIPPSLEKIPKDEIKKLPLLGLNQKESLRKEFWQLVQKAQGKASEHLRTFNLPTSSRRLYHTFIRSVCTVVARTPPDLVEPQIYQLFQFALKQGLDQNILSRLSKICFETFATREPAGKDG